MHSHINFSVSAECQCYGRATSCHFDPQVAVETGGSGGMCDDCTGGTTGRMCHQCVVGFYRNISAELSDPDLCIRKSRPQTQFSRLNLIFKQ